MNNERMNMAMIWKLKTWKLKGDSLGRLIYFFPEFCLGLLKNNVTVNREEILGPESLQYWSVLNDWVLLFI